VNPSQPHVTSSRAAIEDRLRRQVLPILPASARGSIGRGRRLVRQVVRRPRWGNLLRSRPFSDSYGADRGTPADRVYLREFVLANSGHVRGDVLEMQRDEWSSLAARDGVSSITLLDIDGKNPDATLVADLCAPEPFRERSFDCEIVFQTLQYLPDPVGALENLWSALREGGCLLVSVPVIAPVDLMMGEGGDLWHMTPAGLGHLIRKAAPTAEVSVSGYGSLAAAAGFLYGIAAEEMPRAYEASDGRFPVVACAVALKPLQVQS